jgi:uncharacterized membrane protein YbhN (UPF0104 family)
MALVSRQRIPSLARLAVCIAAIGWIIHKTRWGELAIAWHAADKLLLVLGILAFAPVPLLAALRLKLLLDVHSIGLTFWQAVRATFAGSFVINTLPVGTPGGDSVKAFYIARDTPNKHEAVTVVFFDRLIGVLGLVLMSGVAVVCSWGNPAFRSWGPLIGLLLAGTVVGGGVYFSDWTRRVLRLDRLLARLPLGGHLQRIDRAVLEFKQHPGRILCSLLVTNLLQLNCVAGLFLCGWALGIVNPAHPLGSIPVYLGYSPICFLVGALPVGVMENTFQQLFAQAARLGTMESTLLLCLIGVRFTQLVWALPGGPVVLRSRPKPLEAGDDAGGPGTVAAAMPPVAPGS